MTALTNTDPNITYKDLLQMGTGTGAGVTGSVVTVQDGNGTSTALGLATNMVTATAFKIGANQIILGGALTTTGVVTLGSIAITGGFTTGGQVTFSGAFTTTITVTANTTVTFPITGTLSTLAGTEAFTNKTLNGMTVSASTGTFTLTNAKTLAVTNTLTLSGVDSTTITFQGTDTYVGRTTTDTLTNKTITTPTISLPLIVDTSDATKVLTVALSGAVTAKTMTIASSQTVNRTLTLPDATDTLVGKATTDTLTNKTLTTPVINGTITGTTIIPIANGGVDQTAWAAWTPGFTGFSISPTAFGKYKQIGKTVTVMLYTSLAGTSNANTFTVTGLPISPISDTYIRYFSAGLANDNSAAIAAIVIINPGSTTATIATGNAVSNTWTTSGGKYVDFTIVYETV